MAETKDVVKAILLIVVVALLACFALGVFDGNSVSRVYDEDYNDFTFSGNLRNGRFTGHGSMEFQDGELFVGNFAAGRFDGKGTMYCADNKWSFDGYFRDGRVGSGEFQSQGGETVTYNRGETTDTLIAYTWTYEGGFTENGQNGTGTFTFADGSFYVGGFMQGLAEGEGTYTAASDGAIYSGGFKEGRFDGYGTYISPEGWTYEGNFKDGLFDGVGILFSETESTRGVWEEGIQVTRYE
jgi:hypothetical protein